MSIKELLTVLFPHLAGVCVDHVFRSGASVRLKARTVTAEAACPSCGTPSRHRHGRYERRLSDTAAGAQAVLIQLQVNRFFCRNNGCGKKTFAEQVPGLTVRYGRRSVVAGEALRAIALALAGRPGARLAGRLVTAVSRMTLLRLIRNLPEPVHQSEPRVLGVDNFALRRGRIYATILIDITTGKPVDVLADRTADTLADWLRAHPGVQIVCRDRAGAYADGISRGAPEAIQVADRWHLWRNLGEAVERTVTKHRRDLHALTPVPAARTDDDLAATPPPVPAWPLPPGARRDRVAVRTRERHVAVHTLTGQGRSHRQIADELKLSRNTVRQYLQPWRSTPPIDPARCRPPTVRQATGWFLRHPTHLDPTTSTGSTRSAPPARSSTPYASTSVTSPRS